MVRRVYEQVTKTSSIGNIIVATDDQRIFNHVKSWNGNVIMTREDHPSGTDRCREILEKLDDVPDYIINIQGDEPFIDPAQINSLAELLDGQTELATLIKAIENPSDIINPNVVKVVKGKEHALYFSRSPIPHFRNASIEKWIEQAVYFRHIGIYAYRTDVLRQITELPQGELEKTESLEQLRWLENGYRIRVTETEFHSMGIDTPEDLERVLNELKGSA